MNDRDATYHTEFLIKEMTMIFALPVFFLETEE